uniref:RING-type domain-containing protein n=1 Tax=Aegilops tauschii subsp. strangulata TaxID=200361 RepID=A0A453LPJ5_AEGTS
MKFGSIYEEYLRAEQDKYLAKCSHVEYKRLKKCFIDDQQIMVQEGRLLVNYVTMNAIAIRKILKKYDKSPWLIELGAFHLNCDSSDIDEPVGFFKNGFFKNFSCDLTGTQPVMTMAISETIKYDYSLTCPICLDTLFNPYALSCGHLFCKGCACGAASVYIFQGVRSAPPEAKCPVGVFAHAVHMNELDLLIKTRCKDYWRCRLREERTEMVKQSKEYWESQAMLSMGI